MGGRAVWGVANTGFIPHNPRDGVEVAFPGNGSGCGAFMANDGTRGTPGQLVEVPVEVQLAKNFWGIQREQPSAMQVCGRWRRSSFFRGGDGWRRRQIRLRSGGRDAQRR